MTAVVLKKKCGLNAGPALEVASMHLPLIRARVLLFGELFVCLAENSFWLNTKKFYVHFFP